MPRTRKKANELNMMYSLFDIIKEDEKRSQIKAMLRVRPPEDMWKGSIAVPPGSLLESVLHEFEKGSDIPLELPFFQMFHLLSGYMLNQGVTVNVDTMDYQGNIKPDFWTLIMAKSGAGKTFSWKQIRAMCPKVIDKIQWKSFAGIVSGAAFVEELESNNNKLVVRDEFNEFFKRVSNPQGPLGDVHEYLLLAYDNEPIERVKKKIRQKDGTFLEEKISIEEPAFTLLGMCVFSSFVETLTVEDILNGLFARIAVVSSEPDPKRNPKDYPFYTVNLAKYNDKFKRLLKSIRYKKYIANDDAIEGYKTSWRYMYRDDVDMTFYRRIMWKAHKYALVYHILTEQGENQYLTNIDYGWAARALQIHIADCMKLLQSHGMPELSKQLDKVEAFCSKQKAAGLPIRASDIVRNVAGFKHAAEVRAVLSLTDFKEDRLRIRS